ncbi:hypothetical protein F5Y11DRAFT_330256 [Daldinia sp. FL1419]|nr:hypothetical protein F5Y11DRAFT_330256 [Daldinia sp. FL1419]
MNAFKQHVVTHGQKRLADTHQQRRSSRISRSRQPDIDSTFNDVSLYYFIPPTIDYLKDHVSSNRCIQIYEDVISVLPRGKEIHIGPAETKRNPREKPGTPFSMSRADPESVMSNPEMIDALATAANLSPGTAISIRGQIVWHDSMNGSESGMLRPSTGLVSGGRLDRNHMLEDVPNQFVRDQLMNYIATELEDGQKEHAKKAVFPDLSPAEREQYSDWIMKKVEESRPKTEEEMIARIVGETTAKTVHEAKRVLDQAYALDNMFHEVDLTPQLGFGTRDYDRLGLITRSVVQPGLNKLPVEERSLNPGTDIDKDCDQIRATIARFVDGKDWTADQFRHALGGVSRADLTTFLVKDGPKEGKRSSTFQLAWEFFKRREILGLPLPGDWEGEAALQERNMNRASKRQSTDGQGRTTRKRTKRT